MISEHNKLHLPDQNHKNDVEVEMNYNSKLEGVLKMTIDGKIAHVKIEDLYGLAFVVCDPEQQMNLMPVRQTTIRKVIRQHTVKIGKNLKAGEKIIVNCEYDTPVSIEEGLAGNLKKRENNLIIKA